MSNKDAILVVDDEIANLESLLMTLESVCNQEVITCSSGQEALHIISKGEVGLVLLDLIMPNMAGDELLDQLQKDAPELPVIMISALNDLVRAVDLMRRGAVDFLAKPLSAEQLQISIERAYEVKGLRNVHRQLTRGLFFNSLTQPEAFKEIVTQHPSMRTVFQYCEAVAPNSDPILVHGETGTGKELIARAIHDLSGRSGAFVPVNLAGVDVQLFSDTLFGHVRGAFTGADRNRKGLLEQAQGGTLFLDEIGDLEPPAQIKLLRLLQEKEFPVGSDLTVSSKARIVCATHQHLWGKVASGSFRQDLYYRLRTYRVHLPPLRDRKDDLPHLIQHFCASACREMDRPALESPDELPSQIKNHPFPGNIRELRAMVYEAVAQAQGNRLKLVPESDQPRHDVPVVLDAHQNDEGYTFKSFPTLKKAQETLIQSALDRCGGNQKQAAKILGIGPSTLSERLKRIRDKMSSGERRS